MGETTTESESERCDLVFVEEMTAFSKRELRRV